jgi:hypothetical protein
MTTPDRPNGHVHVEPAHPELATAIVLNEKISSPAPPSPALPSPVLAGRPRAVRKSSKIRAKKRTAQFTAASRSRTFETDTRPKTSLLGLPGPRREEEGRGGAMASLDVMRLLIRCPLLPALATAIPARTGGGRGGRPSAVPDLYWILYLAATREFRTQSQLDQELRAHWPVIQQEFRFEHDVHLPDAKANRDVPDIHGFKSWRRTIILKAPGLLEELQGRLTDTSALLALAIRGAEGGDRPHPLHDPGIHDLVAVDGTVLRPPSDVRLEQVFDKNTLAIASHITGSRASSPQTARVHDSVNHAIDKPHGAKDGLFNVVAVVKGTDSYTRVVLSVAIGHAGEGEDPVAMRLLRDLYTRVGSTFPVLLYDGAMKPTYYQDLLAEFGVYCVNPNIARGLGAKPRMAPGSDEALTTLGVGVRSYGTRRGEIKKTYVTPLETIQHEVDGQTHDHHLAADDGAVYELAHHPFAGGTLKKKKPRPLKPTRAERLQAEDGQYYLRLTLTGVCSHGGTFDAVYELRKTPLDNRGRLPWTSMVANIRVIPAAQTDHFAKIYAQRNQIEGYFSWLERCFLHKDRHASWGRPAQTLDLIGAALLHNNDAWAHLAHRHPKAAEALATQLRETFAASTSQAG